METFLANNIFVNIILWAITKFEMLDQIWKKRAPTNDEDASKPNLKILNMGSVSS